jgi:NADPH:quinone reductase
MKAIRMHAFGGPDVLKLEEVPPPSTGIGQIVIDVKAAGVNPVDTYIRAGIYGPRSLPFTLGMDVAGLVAAVGAEVSAFTPGDRVYAYAPALGGYAQQVLTDASNVFPLPKNLSFSEGAAIGVPYSTAYYTLFHRGQAQADETVLIHGASGGVGTAAVQLARSRGLHVIGTASTEKGRALVKAQGAQDVLDHGAPDYLDQLMTLTGQRGVDLIIELAAHVNLGRDLKVLAPRGRVVVVGSRGKVEIEPRDLMSRLADIRGMSIVYISKEELRSIHAALGAGLENGTLKPVIGREMPLAEAAKAHEAILEAGAHGKIVLLP